ncbi:MAG: hypothetical protein M1818_000460 [Claussenomyces sp. TS43310]|nr:MAG: hypothetical protein M1818_000460 [Claussenomyces sp. TS43310]
MSVFSKLKFAKKAATSHKAKEQQNNDKEKESEQVPVPYKHVPTHAAFDALSGAPSSWKHDDRQLIKDQHKRRSQMVVSRTESYMSNAHNGGSQSALPEVPRITRNSSYSSYSPTWNDRGDRTFLEQPVPKAHKSSRRTSSYMDSSIGPSPLISNVTSQNASPIVSSANSASSVSSGNHLEMKSMASMAPQPVVFQDQVIFDRLHTNPNRKLGEAPVSDHPPMPVKRPAAMVEAPEPTRPKRKWGFKSKSREVAAAA